MAYKQLAKKFNSTKEGSPRIPIGTSEKKLGLKFSKFYFTINTNKSKKTGSSDSDFEKKFAAAMEFAHDPENFKSFLVDRLHPGSLSSIVEIRPQYGLEYGGQRGFLHCHSLIRVIHKGQIQVLKPELGKFLHEVFGYSMFVSNVVGEADQSLKEEWYVNKTKKKL